MWKLLHPNDLFHSRADSYEAGNVSISLRITQSGSLLLSSREEESIRQSCCESSVYNVCRRVYEIFPQPFLCTFTFDSHTVESLCKYTEIKIKNICTCVFPLQLSHLVFGDHLLCSLLLHLLRHVP